MDPRSEEPSHQVPESEGDSCGPGNTDHGEASPWTVPPELLPDIDQLVTHDDKPVDNMYVEKLLRLLTEPLYSCWPGPGEGRPFQVNSDVGLFYTGSQPPLAPDVMLSLDVPPAADIMVRESRSYFVWIIGKVPDVVIEVVSDRLGGEATHKMRSYARMGIPYYVIYDPPQILSEQVLRAFTLHAGDYEPIAPNWFPRVGLGVILWQGTYEGVEATWLRWCDRQGQVIPTGKEQLDEERQRAEQERQRAERLAARLRELGIDPSA
jgi:hypothetical protein